MIMENKKQDLNEIANDRVDVGDKMDNDASDQPKSNKILHDDHVALAKTAENENTSESKVMTRYVDVQERMVKYLRGEDIVMDMQLASGAMIQVTKPLDEDVKAEYRPIRVIGKAENVDKAEKLIKALIAFVDVGGSRLLFKDDDDHDCYDTRYDSFRHGQRRSLFYKSSYGQKHSRWPRRRFRNGQIGSRFRKRPYGQRHSRWPVRRFGNGQRRSPSPRPYVRYSTSDSDDSNSDSYSSEYDSYHSYRRRRSGSRYLFGFSPSPSAKRPYRSLSSSCSSSPSSKRPSHSLSSSCSLSCSCSPPSPKRSKRPYGQGRG